MRKCFFSLCLISLCLTAGGWHSGHPECRCGAPCSSGRWIGQVAVCAAVPFLETWALARPPPHPRPVCFLTASSAAFILCGALCLFQFWRTFVEWVVGARHLTGRLIVTTSLGVGIVLSRFKIEDTLVVSSETSCDC